MPSKWIPIINCDNCGKETVGRMGTPELGQICYECGETWARENEPNYDPKFWKFIRKAFDNKTVEQIRHELANPTPPIPHDFKVGDFVIDKKRSEQVYKITKIGGSYLSFDMGRQVEKRVGRNFRGRLTAGRINCYRHATPEEVGNRQ